MTPKKCSSCGCENDEGAIFCRECSTSFEEPPKELFLPTPRRIQQWLWDHFAVKRRQFFAAGLLIGLLAGLIVAIRDSAQGFRFWIIAAGGSFGIAGVSLLSFVETLQRRIQRDQAEGKPTGAQRALFVVLTLIVLLGTALFVAGVCAFFI